MAPLQYLWNYLVCFTNFLISFPVERFSGGDVNQQPLFNVPARPKKVDYPIFEPPNGPELSTFKCEYPTLTDYEFCSEHKNRTCWLRPKDSDSGLPEYSIGTDYENIFPKGITRKYNLTITNETMYPDGCKNSEMKVFNGQYPGPWIEACWGDDIEVTVTNHLPCNGTTIHWHGLRQYNNVENDGVNGVTQCPIAPGDSFTYKFSARQYGTSWYHSHYSVQYADGLAGPLTIHGPNSADYDTAKDPILMTDWNQRSAFQDFSWSVATNTSRPPPMNSILLNGTGLAPLSLPSDQCIDRRPSERYATTFQKGVRYLLRLINTSVDTTFIFSIDSHNLTVVEADFVPIKPYTTNSVLIGIGQRYHVIVEANPSPKTDDGNYWIRTVPAIGCEAFNSTREWTINNSTTGIVRYDPNSDALPTSLNNTFPLDCSDEPYDKLIPVLPWTIPDRECSEAPDTDIGLVPAVGQPYFPEPRRRWQMHKAPMWLNFSDPTLLDLDGSTSNFTSKLIVETLPSAGDQWIELLVTGPPTTNVVAAHPIHLHGHDFAILAQGTGNFSCSVPIKRDNPPRRDVALLPDDGYILIAFKADNPGVWLMHCHIAWHASSGLAMQILENTDQIRLHDQSALLQTCQNWNNWFNSPARDQCKWCETGDLKCDYQFQDDSGI
ncbi:hypothetical protein N0V90_003602 [Kalmusia sp. IMI 367209]|nr:hypothetical protein N0V90_003602 [Kalmusia sp. IMI 367209]